MCIINADLNCDWEAALDYREEEQVPAPVFNEQTEGEQDGGNNNSNSNNSKRFPGAPVIWGKPGRKMSDMPLSEEQRKKYEEKKRMEEWDPRQHRLRHGLRDNELLKGKFTQTGPGVKIG